MIELIKSIIWQKFLTTSLLGHLQKNLLSDNTVSLCFIDSLIPCAPTQIPMFESAPPFLRHYDFKEIEGTPEMVDEEFITLAAEQGFDTSLVPEDSMRTVLHFITMNSDEAIPMVHDYVQQYVEENGPFHGVMAAASYLMRELQTCRKNNRKSSFKLIFLKLDIADVMAGYSSFGYTVNVPFGCKICYYW